MSPRYKSFADALSATPQPTTKPVAANDNKPRKAPEPVYRGTLPALRWLFENHPELAPVVAKAVKALSESNWNSDAVDNDQEIRPTVGEMLKAAKDSDTGELLPVTFERDTDGNPYTTLGKLRFVRGELVEYGETAKGRKLQPRDRITSREEEPSKTRNPSRYMALRGAVASPMDAAPYQHPISAEPALPPMYAPQAGVEANRAELRKHGVDGSVRFEDLPFPATKCPPAIAKGAEFLGGIVQSNGTSSSGAIMWEAPEITKGEAVRVVEAIASGATLKEIGERMGLRGGYAIRSAGDLVVDAAKAISAANDNNQKKIAA